MMFSLDFVSRVVTMTNEDVAKLPRIHLTGKKVVDDLMKWRDKNKDVVRKFKSVVSEGVISVIDKNNFQYFKQEGSKVLHMSKASPQEYIAFVYDIDTWRVTPIKSTITFYDSDMAMQDMITIHATAMAYLNSKGVDTIDDGKVLTISEVVA